MNVCKKCGKTTTESLINEMCKECYDMSKTHTRNLDFPYVINDKITIYVDRSDYEKFMITPFSFCVCEPPGESAESIIQ